MGTVLLLTALAAADFPPPKSLGPVETYGKNLRRSMSLLASSTPSRRNKVRVLFYGQSITEQSWSKLVADDLRKRFPHADLVVENRAIGGFASQLLVRTAETDLYPFQPDLVIFHVYGSHVEYENILKRVRERTVADVLQQTDHLSANDKIDEETDPAKLSPKQWNPWMNHAFLPSMSKKYKTELADVRGPWKRYLKDHGLQPKALLRDGVHLNDHGCYLMAEFVKAHLRHDPRARWDDPVRTYEVGKDVFFKDGKLSLEFDGNRIDAVCSGEKGSPAEVRIDGKRPSEIPELVALTRTTPYPGSKWPCLLRVTADKPRVAEEWALTITEISPDLKRFKFKVAGSVTGDDGEGEGDKRFVSRSGRVVIDPADWNFEYALRVFKKPISAPFAVRWRAVPQFVETLVATASKEPGRESVVTLAQGLKPGRHRVELTGDAPVKALRVYRPTPPYRGD